MKKFLKDYKPYHPIKMTNDTARRKNFQLIIGPAERPEGFYNVWFYDIDTDSWQKEQYGPDESVEDYYEYRYLDNKHLFDSIFNGSWE